MIFTEVFKPMEENGDERVFFHFDDKENVLRITLVNSKNEDVGCIAISPCNFDNSYKKIKAAQDVPSVIHVYAPSSEPSLPLSATEAVMRERAG